VGTNDPVMAEKYFLDHEELKRVIQPDLKTRISATAKSTARPSWLVGVLYDIYREIINRSTPNQPLFPLRNWPRN